MKAAVFKGPGQLDVETVPDPECGPDEVIVKIDVCAVCGTDIRIYNYGQANVVPPQIIGHEIAGVVVEVGDDVSGHSVGDRVTVATPVASLDCKFCLEGDGPRAYCRRRQVNRCNDFKALGYHFPGGFAQYMKVPGIAVSYGNIINLPESVTMEQASLVEPLSCCLNGIEFVNVQKGDSVVVFGSGTIGCMMVELARAYGAEQIILVGRSRERLALAERFNADLYLSVLDGDPVDKVKEMTDGFGADIVICCTSDVSANTSALAMAAKGSRVSFFAGVKPDPVIQFDCNHIHYNEISLFGAFASTVEQYQTCLDLVANKKIDADKFITSQFPLDDLQESIENTANVKGLKMLSLPQE